MPDKIIDYTFSNTSASNPDGALPLLFTDALVAPGPGATPLGQLDQAIDLGTTGKAAVDISTLNLDSRKFCIRIVFQANAFSSDRQNLVESNRLPFAMFLEPGTQRDTFDLVANVAPNVHGWSGPTTRFVETLKPNIWYTADLAYDTDTAALFIDGEIVDVHAFPRGTIGLHPGSGLFIGTWVDGNRNHFNGKVAALQLFNGIPEEIESRLDERRSHAQWFISHKWETVRPRLNLGRSTAGIARDNAIDAYVQTYERGTIMFNDSVGVAFEMHGAIEAWYKSSNAKAQLGYLVSDETVAERRDGRKSVFSKGAIYWCGATGAVAVTNQLYLDYERLGESGKLGFPTKLAVAVSGGLQQEFQGGHMYYRTGSPRAFEVHGGILARHLALGGVGRWGFPITDEMDVKNNGTVIGRQSEFDGCTFFWSSATGAFEVHGDIRAMYLRLKGPAGDLGFPTSDEGDIPNNSGPGKYSCFQQGSILWYGDWSSIIVARPFKVYLGRINTKESEGFGMGQNDLYIRVTLKVGGGLVYNQRHPSSGDWGGRNVHDVQLTIPNVIVPNSPNRFVDFGVDVWESDDGAPFGGGDDHLGVYSKRLDMANGWGMRENSGIFNSGAFQMVNSIEWSVKPQVDVASLSETEKFWGVANRGTPTITYPQYASAFSDVDSDAELWDVTDWLEKAFYELVVDTLASSGNCFGMSLEAIYARKGLSKFGLPINRFTDWNTVRSEFNIKHCYQVGAQPIWWFVGEFLSGNTHDPVDVFRSTRNAFNRGDHPVICIAQNYDFSGRPHCILPVGWDDSSKPWRMTICDPNFTNATRLLTVDPDANTFEYQGSGTYRGGEWSGGRFHYMPWCLLNDEPRTPIWDAILLLLAGTIIILADGSETVGITDIQGNDLDGFGTRATNQLKSGRSIDEFFVGFKGYDAPPPRTVAAVKKTATTARKTAVKKSAAAARVDAGLRPGVDLAVRSREKGTVAGEILMRMQRPSLFTSDRVAVTPDVAAHANISVLIGDARVRPFASELRTQPIVHRAVTNRTAHFLAADPAAMARLTPELREDINLLAGSTGGRDFIHKVRGTASGTFRYALKQGFSELRMESTISAAELHELKVTDFGSSKGVVNMKTGRDKTMQIDFESKLGVGKDRLRVSIDGIPAAPGGEVKLNLKPGLGGVEIQGADPSATGNVTISGVIDGQALEKRYRVPIGDGIRLKPTSILADGQLSVSKIQAIFGPATGSDLIRPNG